MSVEIKVVNSHVKNDRLLIIKSEVYLYLGGGVGGSTVVGASIPATDSQITPNLSSQLKLRQA